MTAESCPYKVVSPKQPPQEPWVSGLERKSLAMTAVVRGAQDGVGRRQGDHPGKELLQELWRAGGGLTGAGVCTERQRR